MVKRFVPEQIQKDMLGIVVLSHGPLATSLLDSAMMVRGAEIKNSAALCLEPNDDPADFGRAIGEIIQAYSAGCVILLDIMSGTPFNQLVINNRRKNKLPCAITGANLPMLISAANYREADMTPDEILELLMEDSLASIVNIKKRFSDVAK